MQNPTPKKRIAVFFDAPGFEDYPFTVEEYRIAYPEVATIIREKGSEFFIVRGQNSFLGKGTFSHGWKFNGTSFIPYREQIHADTVYDKGHFQSDDETNLSNARALDDICTDKWKTYTMFPDLCPKTFLVHSAEEAERAIQALGEGRIVAKPQGGEEGKGVLIGYASQVRESINTFPYLLQEFLDMGDGIPGLVEGPHDFRIICINGEIGVSYIRTPPPGQLRANVAQGGKEIEVLPEQIPQGALEVMQTVDKKMSMFFPRVYSIDMGRTLDGTWKIIELNSKPALSQANQGVTYPRFQRLLAEALLAA